MAGRRRLPDILLLLTGLIACVLRARCHPHHVVKKDLRVDLSLPSLGVILSQRLHRKASQLEQRSQQRDNTVPDDKQKGDATDSQQDWTGSGVYVNGGGVKAWTHRGRFGQDMIARTEIMTFPTEHDHGSVGPDRREQVVLRRWQNLMEPRETPQPGLVMDLSRPPAKLRRSNVDALPFRAGLQGHPKLRAPTAELSATIANEACNCTELLTNDTFSTVVFLVPHAHRTAGEAHKNGSLIREIIRASLSKSVQVERIYEKGCRCGRTGSALPSPSASTATTETKKLASCARNGSLGLKAIPAVVDVTRLPKIASTRKVVPTTAFAGDRMRLPESRLQTAMASAAGRPGGTKCPVRVFVKLPGEELPARAKDCRKLWLPEIVYKEETFWECEDHGSNDCGDRAAVGNTSRTLLDRESGSFSAADATHIAPFAWFATMRRTHSTRNRTATSEAASRERTLPKCGSADDTSQSAPDGRTPESAQCARASSNDSRHLSIRIPFYPFDKAFKMANETIITVTTADENVKRRRYTTPATKSNQTTPKTSTRQIFASSLRKFITAGTHSSNTRSATTHTAPTKSATVTMAQMTYSTPTNAAELPLAWPMRCPQYDGKQGANNSLAFILMCAAAAAAAAPGTCNGSSCDLKKRVAEPSDVPRQRSTHYHLHDDYDFVWTRAPATSTTASRSLHYRARNGTAFPYPFRDSHESPINIRRGGRSTTAARKGASFERKTAIFQEVAATSKGGAAKIYPPRKMATTETTTFLEIIFGERGAVTSRQRGRVAYSGSFAGDDASHRNVERRKVSNKQNRSVDGLAVQLGDVDRKASRPPGKRAAAGHGDAERNVLPPLEIDLLKSKFNAKALVDKVQSSECKEVRCSAANSAEKSLLQQIVVLAPSAGDEYEYYYVEEEPPSTEHHLDKQQYRSVASFRMVPVQNEALERRKRKVHHKSQRFGGSIR